MRLILILLAIIVLPGIIRGAFYNLNKVVCHAFDKSYVEFATCEMKIRSRGVAVFNLNMTLHKKPVHSVVLNLELFKKSNGYRPFLFNQSIDFVIISEIQWHTLCSSHFTKLFSQRQT